MAAGRVVVRGRRPDRAADCKKLGLTEEDLKKIAFEIDNSTMKDNQHGFPTVLSSEIVLGAFDFKNFNGSELECGAHLSELPITIHGKLFTIKFMLIAAPYAAAAPGASKMCTTDFHGGLEIVPFRIFPDNKIDSAPIPKCTILLKADKK